MISPVRWAMLNILIFYYPPPYSKFKFYYPFSPMTFFDASLWTVVCLVSVLILYVIYWTIRELTNNIINYDRFNGWAIAIIVDLISEINLSIWMFIGNLYDWYIPLLSGIIFCIFFIKIITITTPEARKNVSA